MAKKSSGSGLVSLSENQLYPRMAKPEDFKVGSSAQGGGSDKHEIYDMTEAQEAPRTTQDSGMGKSGAGTPSVAGSAKGLNSSQNHSEEGTKASGTVGVDFKTGQHICDNPLPK